MFRTVSSKLILAFLATSLVSVIVLAGLSRQFILDAFNDFVIDTAINGFGADALAYYQRNDESWEGIDRAFGGGNQPPLQQPNPPNNQNQPPLNQPPPQPNNQPTNVNNPRFALANLDGEVIIPLDEFRLRDVVSADVLANGLVLFDADGVQIATILTTDATFQLTPSERRYLDSTEQAVNISVVIAVSFALAVGVFLSWLLTRPLREITQAIQSMDRRNLQQTVPVRSKDEFGTLAQAFNQMSADLAHAEQLRRQMTADIAHDLRSPLTVIVGYLESLREQVLKPTPERFDAMYAEAMLLQHLIGDLRTLTLADAGELRLNRVPIRPPELLKRVATNYQHQAESDNVTIAVNADENLPAINLDPDRMLQVLGNLVSNALRYTPQNGAITLTAQNSNNQIRLTVKDTGKGIPPEDVPNIFERFYRGDKSRNQATGESGLGLAIAKSIVEAHDGTISVNSTIGIGTTFTIRLPI